MPSSLNSERIKLKSFMSRNVTSTVNIYVFVVLNWNKMDTRRSCKLLLAATGSVAALKIPNLIKALLEIPPEQMTYDFEVMFTKYSSIEKINM